MRYALTSAIAAAIPASSSSSTSGSAAGRVASGGGAVTEVAVTPSGSGSGGLGATTGAGEPFASASKILRHSSGTLAGLSRKSARSWATYAAFKPVDSVAAIADVL